MCYIYCLVILKINSSLRYIYIYISTNLYISLQIGRMARHRGNGKINETPSIDETEYED